MKINNRSIRKGEPVYIIAEMSANHGQDYDRAVEIIKAAKEAGADAIKLQTYTPDTMTILCDTKYFQIGKGTVWEGYNLHKLYQKAYMPWEWQSKLQQEAEKLGIDFFSTPFDSSAVDFLQNLNVPVYKIASLELVNLPLLKRIGQTNKPVIMSIGMATLPEIEEAAKTLYEAGTREIALLKCTGAYPALPEDMNLRTIPFLMDEFNVPVGISDHSLSIAVPVAAVTLGACIVEKHFTLSRKEPGPDSTFSLEPIEFRMMVNTVRDTEKALGRVYCGATEHEIANRVFRQSLFVVKNIKAGETFTLENVRLIRPGYGLHARYLNKVLQCRAQCDIQRGTPLAWGLVR